ncbi:MAG TPA: hypothetical protein VNZ26_30455 [Vicinamibacterales bacterium]|jgi:hypothetical protein|nr:hypothetical protein [Vicinamibacterales bacterium]
MTDPADGELVPTTALTRRILLVDDDVDAADLLADAFASIGP